MKTKRRSNRRRRNQEAADFPTNRLVQVQAVECNEKGVITRVVVGDEVLEEIARAENRRRNRKGR